MNEVQHLLRDDDKRQDSNGVNLLDYFTILLKWRKFILGNILVMTILAIIVSFVLPKWYRATCSLMPPKEQSVFGELGSVGSILKELSPSQKIGGFGQNLGVYNYLAILNSRTAMESVVKKFDLIKVYDMGDSSMENTIKELKNNTLFEVQEEDYITIDVFDKDPVRAAAMANYFVETLNNISIQLGTQEARNNREFIEKRLEKSKTDLRAAEDDLRKHQEQSGLMIAPEQSSAGVSTIAELYGMKAKKEVEIAILERGVTKNNEALQQLQIELSELDKKLATFPEAGIASYRLYRNVAIQQKIVEYLIPLYEQAKIEEQKDVPVILVLDRATPPEKKDKPKRSLIVLLVAVITVVFSISAVFLIEGWSKFKRLHPEQYQEFRDVVTLTRTRNTSKR